MKLTRRETLTLAAAATVAGMFGLPSIASAKEGDVIDQLKLMVPAGIPDKVLGDPAAKVTFIEYASPTCPHCALFSNTTLQPFIEKYVTTGKVKLIIRPFARNNTDAAIFMLAEAAARSVDGMAAPAPMDASSSAASSEASSMASSEMASAPAAADPANPSGYSQAAIKAYENLLSTFYKTQDTWGLSDKPLDAIKAVAFQLGFNEESFMTALKDMDFFAKVQTMRDQALNDFGLEGTPTFYINGKQLVGEKTIEQLSTEIDPLL